jgi:hypothetical protein
MKIFKIQKTYIVVAPDEAGAKSMVTAPRVSELFVTQETIEELPPISGATRWMKPWLAAVKQQVLG